MVCLVVCDKSRRKKSFDNKVNGQNRTANQLKKRHKATYIPYIQNAITIVVNRDASLLICSIYYDYYFINIFIVPEYLRVLLTKATKIK